MSIPLVGGPAPAKPAIVDLFKGPGATFGGGVGAWTVFGTGTTGAYDAAVGVDASHGSIKLHTTTNAADRYGHVAVPGTFKSGRTYHVAVLLMHDALASAELQEYFYQFGDFGASDSVSKNVDFKAADNGNYRGLPGQRWVQLVLSWKPTGNRTSVALEIGRDTGGTTGAHDLWIAKVRVAEALPGSTGLLGEATLGDAAPAMTVSLLPFSDGNYSGIGYPAPGFPYMHGLVIQDYGVFIQAPPEVDGNASYVNAAAELDIYATQPSNARRALNGLNVELGPDYVGWTQTARSTTEAEFWPDGDYDLYLLDGSADGNTRHWWHEEADGAYKAGAGRKSRLGLYFQETFHLVGGLTVGTAKNEPAGYLQLPYPCEVDEVRVHVGTAPTGSTLIVDVNVNGTTIFTTQANRPTVAISGTDATSGAPDTTKFAKNDRLSFDLDQVGSTVPGSDLTVMVRGRYLW